MKLSDNVYITNHLYYWKTILKNFHVNVCLSKRNGNSFFWDILILLLRVLQIELTVSQVPSKYSTKYEQHTQYSSTFDCKIGLKLLKQVLNL